MYGTLTGCVVCCVVFPERIFGIAGLGIPDGVLTETVAVFARPARTEVIVLLLTVCPLAMVVITDEAL